MSNDRDCSIDVSVSRVNPVIDGSLCLLGAPESRHPGLLNDSLSPILIHRHQRF